MVRGRKSKALRMLIPLLVGALFLVTNAIAQEVAPELLEKPIPYTGLIKNNTNYDLSIPSLNSGATLIVPAKGMIEYTVWAPKFEVDAYRNGKKIWCDWITVDPDKYQYKCKKYDFVAEITKPVKRVPREEGVRGLG
jgi:hypothetical protein